MRIAIMIMAVNAQPSLRNVEAFKNSCIAYQNEMSGKLKHDYEFYIYWSERSGDNIKEINDEKYNNVHNIIINEDEGIYRTFEKTFKVFRYIEPKNFDLFVRVNISMYLNIDLLDAVIDKLKSGNIYCNAINSYINLSSDYVNDLYCRGDLLIFDKSIMNIILSCGEKYMYCDLDVRNRNGIEHVDDCMLGLCFIDGYGKDYYEHLYMLKYNYIPDSDIYQNTNISKYAIGSRIKTVPPEVGYSGYSWDDNEYRLRDGVKMEKLFKINQEWNMDYSLVKMSDVLVDKNNSRPTLYVQAKNLNVYDVFWKYLDQKRK